MVRVEEEVVKRVHIIGEPNIISLMSSDFVYTLKKVKNTKNIRISIKPSGEIVISKPWFVPQCTVDRFVRDQGDWINKQLATIKENKGNADSIWLQGKKYTVLFSIGIYKQVFTNTGKLLISAYSPEAAKRTLKAWFIKEAVRVIKNNIKQRALLMQIDYKDIRIKDQATRWGSCSSQKNLNFSWRLLAAPPVVMDYVIIHELAHIREMNHSHKFWAIVEQFDPEFRTHRRWLRRFQNLVKTMWYD